MPKLPRLPAASVVAALKQLGFEEVRQKGSHLVLCRTTTKADGSAAAVICVVPLHRRDLAVGTPLAFYGKPDWTATPSSRLFDAAPAP